MILYYLEIDGIIAEIGSNLTMITSRVSGLGQHCKDKNKPFSIIKIYSKNNTSL